MLIFFMLQGGATSIWFADWAGVGPLASHVDYVHVVDSQLHIQDIWINEEWNFDGLYMSLPADMLIHITCKLPGPATMLQWERDPASKYIASSGYNWFLSFPTLLSFTDPQQQQRERPFNSFTTLGKMEPTLPSKFFLSFFSTLYT
ncbi:hypothetical protein RJT34_25826 [Clitoria ternatea]|uniref:Uncharacterized protein n=1 Tax=Clitoria ternatea TaxID=43366 RepID=A0AAN9FT38_CLITE